MTTPNGIFDATNAQKTKNYFFALEVAKRPFGPAKAKSSRRVLCTIAEQEQPGFNQAIVESSPVQQPQIHVHMLDSRLISTARHWSSCSARSGTARASHFHVTNPLDEVIVTCSDAKGKRLSSGHLVLEQFMNECLGGKPSFIGSCVSHGTRTSQCIHQYTS